MMLTVWLTVLTELRCWLSVVLLVRQHNDVDWSIESVVMLTHW